MPETLRETATVQLDSESMVQKQQTSSAIRRVDEAQRLGFAEMRHEVERLRIQSQSTGDKFAIISINCSPTTARPLGRILEEIDRVEQLLEHGWAHETIVGWIGRDQLGVLLPNATPVDAWQYAQKVREHCDSDESAVQVFVNHETRLSRTADGPVRIRSIDSLFLRPIEPWKRWLDITLASIALLVAIPFLLIAALMIKLTSHGPVIFSQRRVGYGGKPFPIYKLRTMRQDADDIKDKYREHNEVDGLGFKIENDPRVTTIGRILRKTSLDELPQLWNVICGHMSLVGPRPLPCNDWHPTDLWMNARHDVKPGITCTWQITGRSSVSFEEWMMMDIDYIESRDMSMDLRLIAQTVPAVISQRGAS